MFFGLFLQKFFLAFLFCLNLVFSLKAYENLIENITVAKNRIDICLNKKFSEKYLNNNFFVEYRDDEIDLTRLDYSIITMPCFMNLISLIWASGEKYAIDSMDSNLYFSLNNVREIFKKLYPRTEWNGELIPQVLVDNRNKFLREKKDGIALLFSHGLDSIVSSFRYQNKNQLLITAWGHSDCPLGKDALWLDLKNIITRFGKKFGHKNTFLRSNYHDFVNFSYLDKTITPEITRWRIEAVEGLGWVGLVAPILLCKGYTQFCIASSYSWGNPYPQAALPIIDHTIKFADVDIIHDGFELTRAQKNEYVSKECIFHALDHLFMRVCVRTTDTVLKNCCKCEKCLRTITGFLIIGEDLEKFGFSITNNEAICNIKNFFKYLRSNNKLVDRISFYWKELQDLARKYIPQSFGEHKQFLAWFIEQNIDEVTKYRPVTLLIWKDFKKYCNSIPEKYL